MSCKLAMFGDHRHCGNGDIMVLVSHVIVQDLLTKGLNNFIGGSQLS